MRLPAYIKGYLAQGGWPSAGALCPHGGCCTGCCTLCWHSYDRFLALNARTRTWRQRIREPRRRRAEYNRRLRHMARAQAKGRTISNLLSGWENEKRPV